MLLPDNDIDSPAPPQWNPPARLEARFARRRSRRAGTASPSTHHQTLITASNLATIRRTTLLEDRRSLLRTRAMHVEKVRRSRADSHSALSERLLALQASMHAAQRSRNAILAKIAGSCASEVARARRAGVEVRKRREMEADRLRETHEERMVSAQRRRERGLKERVLKRREKNACGVFEEAAALTIQRAWRGSRDKRIVADFVALGITIEGVREGDFMEVSTRFQDEEVLRATSRLLTRCGLLEGIEGVEGAVEKCCRTFLSAYLILGHPTEVLSNDGEKEKVKDPSLITRSKDLLVTFESFIFSVPTFPQPEALYNAWSEFSTAFDAWKSLDSEIFVQTMVAQYAELDLIWQKVKDDTAGGAAEDYRAGIRDNQLLLLVRIRRLAGDRTRDLIRAAVKEARRTRLPRKEKRDTKPREVPSAASATVSTESPPSTAMTVSQPTPALSVPPPQPARNDQPTQHSFGTVAGDGDGTMSNRQIIHELALDKDFRLQPRKRNRIEKIVEDAAKGAFWAKMREDIAEGQLEKWIPALADTVRGKLLRLLDPNGSLHRAVADSMDITLITQQCHNGAYNHERLISYVLELLPKICSPARDEDVKALVEDTNSDYITRLQKLLDVLEAMQLDHANFLLMISAPQVVPEAIPYERKLFQSDLDAGRTTLSKTRTWLETAQAQLPAEASASEVHMHAFLNVLFSLAALDEDEIPETWHLDHQRVKDTREALRTVILGGAIVLTVKTLLRRDVRGAWKEAAACVSELLKMGGGTAEVAAGVRRFVESTTATPTGTLVAVGTAVTRILERGVADPVVRVVCNRLRGFVKERLVERRSAERVRLAAGAGETLAGWGVGEWIGVVGGVVERVGVWVEVDRGVSAGWYNEILGVE